MSTTIDQRVVEMRFDNKQFEENVAESISTLDKLKSALNFDKIGDAFGTVTRAASKVDLSPIGTGIETVIVKFNALEMAAVHALSNIIENGINKVQHAVNSLTFDQIHAGWNKLEEKTQSVQTIMAATGKDIEEVSSQLDRLNWFSDETSYSFTDMTSNVGKFTSVGIELDKAVSAMEGIATWAALSGANSQTASRAMYNLSQAMGVGSVKLMDWRSIENAGMATAEFKQTVLDTAVATGTLTKSVDGLYKTTKGTEVTVQNFSSTLSEGWFDAQTLMQSLDVYGSFANELSMACEKTGITATELIGAVEEYSKGTLDLSKVAEETGMSVEDLLPIFKKLSGAEYEMGRKAFAAAQEAKTFTDVIDATADAVSTKWMNVFEILFGNYNQAKEFYTDMAEIFYTIFAEPVDKLKEFLKAWSQLTEMEDGTGRIMGDVFRTGITDLLWSISNILDIIKSTLGAVIPKVTIERLKELTIAFGNAMETFQEFTENYSISERTTERLRRVWGGLSAVFDIFKQLLGSLKPLVSDMINVISVLADDILSLAARLGDWLVNLAATIRDNQFFQTVLQKLHDILIPVTSKIAELYAQFREKIETHEFATISEILENIKNKLSPIFEFLQKIFDRVKDFFTSFNISEKLSSIWGFIKNIGDSIAHLVSQINLGGVLKGLEDILISIGKVAKDIFSNFSIPNILTSLGKGITNLTGSLKEADLSTLFSNLTKGTMVFGGFNLGKLLGNAADAIGGVKEGGLKGFLSPITDVFDQLKETIGSFTRGTDGDKIRSIAVSIGILTAALFVLSGVDTEKIDSGLKGLGVSLGEMLGSIFVVSKMDLSGGKQLGNAAKAMIEIAIACWVLSKAVVPFTEMNGDQLKKAGGALTVILAEFLGFIAIFGNISKANTKGIFKVSNGFDKQIKNAAVAMIELGIAVKIFASAAKDFGGMEENDLKEAIVSITILLAEFAGFSALASNFDSKKIMVTATAMIELGLAMKIFSSVASSLGKMSFGELATAIGMMTYIMVEMGLFMVASEEFVTSSGKLAAVAASMILLGIAFGTFATSLGIIALIDSSKLLDVVAVMLTITLAMGAFMAIAYAVSGSTGSIAAIAASMILLGIAMQSFASAGMMFSMVNWESLGKMGAVFTVISVAMALMAPLLPTIGAGLTAIGIGLIAIGGGLTLIGVGIASLSLGVLAGKVADIAARFVWLSDQMVQVGQSIKKALTMDVFIQFLTALPNLITGVFSGLIAGIIEGIGIIIGSFSTLIDGIKDVIISLFDLIKDVFPALIETILSIFSNIVDSIANHLPEVLSSVLKLLLLILNGLVEYVPDIVSAIVKLLVKAIDALTEHIPELLISAMKFVDALFGEIIRTIRDLFTSVEKGDTAATGLPKLGKELSDFWKNIEPFIDGVKNLKPEDLAAVADIATAVLALTAAEVLDGMTAWFGKGKDAEEFGDSLVKFAPKLKEFATIMDGVDGTVISASAVAIAEIAKAFSSEVFKTGGVVQWFKGEVTDLEQLGEKLVKIAPKFREFETIMNGTNPEDLKRSAESVTTIAEAFDKETFKTGGFTQIFKGEVSDLEKLGNKLAAIAPKLREFESVMNGTDPEAVKKATLSVTAIADAFNNQTFKTGGLAQWVNGEISFDTLINNLTSFGTGIATFYTTISDIDTEHMTSLIDAVRSILDMTKGTGEIKATIDKSFGESMKKIAQSGIDNFITVITNSGNTIQTNAKTLLDKFILGMNDKKTPAINAMDGIVKGVTDAIKTKNETFKKSGTEVATSFILGIKGEMLTIYNAAKDLAMGAASTMSDQFLLFYNAGINVMDGYILGMQSKAELISSKARELGSVSLNAMATVLDEHSPSKAFFKIGAYAGEGFVEGLGSYIGYVGDASSALGDASLLTITDAIEDFLQNDLETEPVIRPVLDLSDIEAGSRRLDSMMSSDLAYMASRDISEGTAATSSMVDNSRVFGGFTFNVYSNASDPKAVADELGAEVIRRMRIFSTI